MYVFHLALAVEVRQCTLRSRARGWGPAVPTELLRSRLRPGSAHWDLELAVEEIEAAEVEDEEVKAEVGGMQLW